MSSGTGRATSQKMGMAKERLYGKEDYAVGSDTRGQLSPRNAWMKPSPAALHFAFKVIFIIAIAYSYYLLFKLT